MSARSTIEQVAGEHNWIVQREKERTLCFRDDASIEIEFTHAASIRVAYRHRTPGVERLGPVIHGGLPGILFELRRQR